LTPQIFSLELRRRFFLFFFFFFFSVLLLGGVTEVYMSGFVSVRGGVRSGSIVARPLGCGWVWACRPMPAGGLAAGFSPAPACVFVPFDSFASALAVAQSLSGYGLRCWVRSGSTGSPVFSASGLPVPAYMVKVAVPEGRRCGWLVSFIQSVLSAGVIVSAPAPCLSSLAFAL
jgi:hypothetical protein